MNYQPMQYIYQSSGKPDAVTLVLLHGTGGDEYDLLSVGRRFGADVSLLGLRGNVPEGGMPRFFRRKGMGIFDEEDLIFRTHELVSFIQETAAKEKFDLRRLVAVGYSNGANIAGSTLALYPGFLAGAILFRPMQPFRQMPEIAAVGRIPVFMSNGSADPTIRAADTEWYVALLQQAGYDISSHTLSAGHELTPADLQLAVAWYRQHFQ